MRANNIRSLIRLGLCAALLSLLAGLPSIAQTNSGLTPLRLRCEYKINPLGIDALHPRLDWIVESDRRGQGQSAYRIIVSSSESNLAKDIGDLWDTGKVDSDETIQIPYQGKPLKSGMRCLWKVRVWDNEGNPSAWTEPAAWTMGLLESQDWKAQWIGLDSAWQSLGRAEYLGISLPPNPLKLGHKIYIPSPYLRKEFKVDRPVKRAFIYATALGLYELHINGQRIGADYFTPGWADYNKRIYYQAYDVSNLIQQGQNAIGAILADGWYAGNVGWLGQRIYGSKLRLLAQIQIEYEDGSIQIVATDDSWRASHGPIREADIQAGESYDARLEMPGWDKPGFDDRGWKKVDFSGSVKAKIQAYPGIPVRKIQEIKPITMKQPKPGVYVFNLGQNFSGWARVKTQGKAGR